MSESKKIRSETGTRSKSSQKQVPGAMYESWKKKRRMEIDSTGDGEIVQNNPNFRYNTKVKSELRDSNQIRKAKTTRKENLVKNAKKSPKSRSHKS